MWRRATTLNACAAHAAGEVYLHWPEEYKNDASKLRLTANSIDLLSGLQLQLVHREITQFFLPDLNAGNNTSMRACLLPAVPSMKELKRSRVVLDAELEHNIAIS